VSDSPVHVIIQKHQYLFIYLQLHFQHPISLSENQVPSCISFRVEYQRGCQCTCEDFRRQLL